MNATAKTTKTTTIALVLNQKLHLALHGYTSRCAGKRYSAPVVSLAFELPVFDPSRGAESANEQHRVVVAAEREFAATLTDEHRANLCEKCAAHLA